MIFPIAHRLLKFACAIFATNSARQLIASEKESPRLFCSRECVEYFIRLATKANTQPVLRQNRTKTKTNEKILRKQILVFTISLSSSDECCLSRCCECWAHLYHNTCSCRHASNDLGKSHQTHIILSCVHWYHVRWMCLRVNDDVSWVLGQRQKNLRSIAIIRKSFKTASQRNALHLGGRQMNSPFESV